MPLDRHHRLLHLPQAEAEGEQEVKLAIVVEEVVIVLEVVLAAVLAVVLAVVVESRPLRKRKTISTTRRTVQPRKPQTRLCNLPEPVAVIAQTPAPVARTPTEHMRIPLLLKPSLPYIPCPCS